MMKPVTVDLPEKAAYYLDKMSKRTKLTPEELAEIAIYNLIALWLLDEGAVTDLRMFAEILPGGANDSHAAHQPGDAHSHASMLNREDCIICGRPH